MERKERELSL